MSRSPYSICTSAYTLCSIGIPHPVPRKHHCPLPISPQPAEAPRRYSDIAEDRTNNRTNLYYERSSKYTIPRTNIVVKAMTQSEQVILAMKQNGGYATLKRLNEIVDFSGWRTKTPEATVRRIVQENNSIFKIQPGLWALKEYREQVLKLFQIQQGNRQSEEQFSHGYYQGLLVEIGKMQHYETYVPAQDKQRRFLDKTLGEITDTTVIPQFTYEELVRRARTVDVIWFNQRKMPSEMFEVEHTTDIKNSLSKFYELQDFLIKFSIVADESRKKEFEDKLHVSIFKPIEDRVRFLGYEQVAKMFTGMKSVVAANWS